MKPLHVILFGLIAVLSTSGCASVRVKTDLLPETDPKLTSSAGKFYIAELHYFCDDGVDRQTREQTGLKYLTGNQTDRQTQPARDVAYGKKLLRVLRKECPSRYPLLFSKYPEESIPLFVSVEEEFKQNNRKIAAWMLGTLLIVPTILPAPFAEADRNITVSTGLWNGTGSNRNRTIRMEFHRKQIGWATLLTPLGLIPIPGKSDFPKESEAFNMGRSGFDDIPQVAQQVATALAKIVADKEPDFWTTPLRTLQQPGYFPAAPDGAPSTMPLPTENVAPF